MSRVAETPRPISGSPDCHRAFFALRPSGEAVAALEEMIAGLGLRQPMRADRLHMTLLMIDDLPALPPLIARALIAIGQETDAEPFEIALDRVTGGPGNIVAVPSRASPALRDVQARLAAALRSAGLVIRQGWRFSPHVTLGYGAREAIDRPIPPIRWQADAVVLIDSLVGLTRHETLGRWPLIAQPRLL